VFEAMEALGKNGVPAAKINLEFVLGNKVMVGTVNRNREYFEAAVRDLTMAEAQYPGWVARLLTHPARPLSAAVG
jgi:hypothetical protein